jgi:hypothetical protein
VEAFVAETDDWLDFELRVLVANDRAAQADVKAWRCWQAINVLTWIVIVCAAFSVGMSFWAGWTVLLVLELIILVVVLAINAWAGTVKQRLLDRAEIRHRALRGTYAGPNSEPA